MIRRGIYAATLTPVAADLAPDAELAVPYYRNLLERGCHGLIVLGTTGEAMSFSVRQRVAFMEAVASGIDPGRMTCGTGASSLADCVDLTRRALDLGFAAALVMPPFFYRNPSDDGVVAFFDALFARVGAPSGRILLYNFPRMSGVTFHPALTTRLLETFPGVIAGMKESSNDRELQRALLASHSRFLVFPGSEAYLAEALADGVAGCISGSVCLWPELARAVFERRDPAEAERLRALRETLSHDGFIADVRARTAAATNDPRWSHAMPPLAEPT